MDLGDLPRNDVKAAVAYVRALYREGKALTPEAGQFLYMLQDDPAALMHELDSLHAARQAGIPGH